MKKNSAFAGFLGNPTIARAAKVDAVVEMFGGPKSTPITKNLMITMASNNRIGEADKVRVASKTNPSPVRARARATQTQTHAAAPRPTAVPELHLWSLTPPPFPVDSRSLICSRSL